MGKSTASWTRVRKWTLGLVLIGLLAPSIASMPDASAAYAGRDGAIAFARRNQVYRINADGTGLKQLTSGAKNYLPRWSPDGRRIAYVHEDAAGRNIWVMNADGTNKRRVTTTGNPRGATWSPDGRWLAYGAETACTGGYSFSDCGILSKIRSTAPYGAPVQILGAYGGSTLYPISVRGTPAWSGDGKFIAYHSGTGGAITDFLIARVELATGLIVDVEGSGASCCGDGDFANSPAVSADGSRIAFGLYVSCGECPPAVWNVLVYTTVPYQAASPWTRVAGDVELAFAPSGGRVVLTNEIGGAHLVVARADGTRRRTLTTGYSPDWQPVR